MPSQTSQSTNSQGTNSSATTSSGTANSGSKPPSRYRVVKDGWGGDRPAFQYSYGLGSEFSNQIPLEASLTGVPGSGPGQHRRGK
jgi:hypothetical protein